MSLHLRNHRIAMRERRQRLRDQKTAIDTAHRDRLAVVRRAKVKLVMDLLRVPVNPFEDIKIGGDAWTVYMDSEQKYRNAIVELMAEDDKLKAWVAARKARLAAAHGLDVDLTSTDEDEEENEKPPPLERSSPPPYEDGDAWFARVGAALVADETDGGGHHDQLESKRPAQLVIPSEAEVKEVAAAVAASLGCDTDPSPFLSSVERNNADQTPVFAFPPVLGESQSPMSCCGDDVYDDY